MLTMQCEGVIYCPKQKALIVRIVKDGIGAMALAIGDGANDVSMIQVRAAALPSGPAAVIAETSRRLPIWASGSPTQSRSSVS